MMATPKCTANSQPVLAQMVPLQVLTEHRMQNVNQELRSGVVFALIWLDVAIFLSIIASCYEL